MTDRSSNLPTPSVEPTPHWAGLARHWQLTGSPLRPAPADVVGYQHFVDGWSGVSPRVLLLGVTPELYRMPWPADRDFLAVDRTPAMIQTVWPGPVTEVCQGDWTELPLPPASRDLALCDGGLHLLDHPVSQACLVKRLHEVMAPRGRVILRLFTRPERFETPTRVISDLMGGGVPNLNVLKLRLGMALQTSSSDGVGLATIWRYLREAGGDWETLAARLGWPLDHLQVIDSYRESPLRYSFLSRQETEALFLWGGGFRCLGYHESHYNLSERCPVVAFERC
jgi:SAM-dependent methyltransferase